MSSGPRKSTGLDPHERARVKLGESSAHFSAWIDGLKSVFGDWSAICSEALERRSYPPERWLPDALALSINSWHAWCSCCYPRTGPGTAAASAPNEPTIVFDVRSEMAGPILVAAAAGATAVVSKTDLVDSATGSAIAQAKVRVRLGPGGAVVTLTGIETVALGEYEGSITFGGFGGDAPPLTLPLKAVCKNQLFWIGGPPSSPPPPQET